MTADENAASGGRDGAGAALGGAVAVDALPRTLDSGAFAGASFAQWRALADADLKGAPFEKRLVTHTYEGLMVQPLYTARDMPAAALGQRSALGTLVRGARVLGNAVGGWEIRQERGEADIERANAAIREDLEGGVASVVLRLDACARGGMDPRDEPGALLAGRDGIAAYDLAALGAPAERLARVNFCRNLFEAGGFEVVGGEGDGSAEAAVAALEQAALVAEIAVICGPDARYATDVSRVAPALRSRGARCVVLAGNPGASEGAYRAAGVDRFVFVKCDVVALLRDLMQVAEGVGVPGGVA
jgi:methylmalonyl-CoA mutase cobalamin-binding subunit